MIDILLIVLAWVLAGCAVAWLLGRVADACTVERSGAAGADEPKPSSS